MIIIAAVPMVLLWGMGNLTSAMFIFRWKGVVAAMMPQWCGGGSTQYVSRNILMFWKCVESKIFVKFYNFCKLYTTVSFWF